MDTQFFSMIPYSTESAVQFCPLFADEETETPRWGVTSGGRPGLGLDLAVEMKKGEPCPVLPCLL